MSEIPLDKDDQKVTISKLSVWKGISAILGVVLLISLFTQGFGIGQDGAPSAGAAVGQPQQRPTPSAPIDMTALADDDPFLGEEDAPVVIVEFSDYECPFCARFYQQTLSQIKEEYVDTGKVKFVYRDFPLSFHPNAQKAAVFHPAERRKPPRRPAQPAPAEHRPRPVPVQRRGGERRVPAEGRRRQVPATCCDV